MTIRKWEHIHTKDGAKGSILQDTTHYTQKTTTPATTTVVVWHTSTTHAAASAQKQHGAWRGLSARTHRLHSRACGRGQGQGGSAPGQRGRTSTARERRGRRPPADPGSVTAHRCSPLRAWWWWGGHLVVWWCGGAVVWWCNGVVVWSAPAAYAIRCPQP